MNLTSSAEPQDIYNTVAEELLKTIKKEVGKHVFPKCPKHLDLAQARLDYGINRSITKKGTMTLPYGSKTGTMSKDGEGPTGMVEQFMTGLMADETKKVLKKEISKHPFGDTQSDQEWHAYFLASRTYKACLSVLSRPLKVMTVCQTLAKECAKDNKPLVWHTPIGFRVVLEYPKMKEGQISLATHHGRYQPSYLEPIPNMIDSKEAARAAAPGFIHALDSCHLQMVVLACAEEGIELALVHDSFSCHPNHAARLRTILVKQFHQLYSEQDVLADLVTETEKRLGRKIKVEMPSMGSLDIGQVLLSEYAFS